MKPLFKQKSYDQIKKADYIYLPQIYERIIVILTHCSYEGSLFFEDSIKYIIHLLNQLLSVFKSQTRVIKCCAYNISATLDNPNVVEQLLFLLNEQREDDCLLSKFVEVILSLMKIFEHEVKYYDEASYHSNEVIICLLNLFESVFTNLKLNDIFPNMRRRIYNQICTL